MGDTADLVFAIDPSRLPGPPYPVFTDVMVSSKPSAPPIPVRLSVSRPIWYKLDAPLVNCKRGGNVEFPVRLLAPAVSLKCDKVSAFEAPVGVSVERLTATDDSVVIRLNCGENATPGYYQLRCRFGPIETHGEFAVMLRVE